MRWVARTVLVISCSSASLTAVLAYPGETRVATGSQSRSAIRPSEAPQPGTPAVAVGGPHTETLRRYCITCHNDRLRTGGFSLEGQDLTDVGANPALWEKVVRKLRARAMPPPGAPRSDESTYEAMASDLEATLDRHAAAHPNPGRLTVHRLNRAEYTNVIRDLLGLHIDARALLPSDESGYGFDNIADVLTLSPGLLERYLSAARKISRIAIGDPTVRPVTETYSVPKHLAQDDRISDDFPLGSRGGAAFRHVFPLDGEYGIKIRLRRTWNDLVRGAGERHQLDVRVDGERVRLFSVGGEGPDLERQIREREHNRRAYGIGFPDREPTPYELNADAGLELRVPVKAGARTVTVTFLRQATEPEGLYEPPPGIATFAYASRQDPELAVAAVQIAGPYGGRQPEDSATRRRIFVCYPSARQQEEPCARQILSTLGRRAYRRPVTPRDLQTLLGFYNAGRSQGGFEAGIQFALRQLLTDLEFLFRVERPSAGVGAPHRISDLDLASRLSFFLWSSIPDDELLDLAERQKLTDSRVLEQQVHRMLADPRSKALVQNFVGQWLHLRNVRVVTPDPDAFPEFDDNLREALNQETELFFENQLRDDRSVLEMLTSNYTFLNERLARHYQIPGVKGSHFRRVTLDDPRRAGLLGHGSILTVTSYATRTSPVTRGKWLLENILGTPPPPPPPDVPALEEKTATGKPRSMREAMEQHRNNPVCASCHSRMDPLGFALENFDAIGRWRTTSEAGTPIDAAGGLPDGTKFEGAAGLRDYLLSQREEFVKTVADKLLTYALGRGLEYYDAPVMRKLVRDASAADYRWSSLILGVVRSLPFQMRPAEEAQDVQDRSSATEKAR